jgi:hypothetical protein
MSKQICALLRKGEAALYWLMLGASFATIAWVSFPAGG